MRAAAAATRPAKPATRAGGGAASTKAFASDDHSMAARPGAARPLRIVRGAATSTASDSTRVTHAPAAGAQGAAGGAARACASAAGSTPSVMHVCTARAPACQLSAPARDCQSGLRSAARASASSAATTRDSRSAGSSSGCSCTRVNSPLRLLVQRSSCFTRACASAAGECGDSSAAARSSQQLVATALAPGGVLKGDGGEHGGPRSDSSKRESAVSSSGVAAMARRLSGCTFVRQGGGNAGWLAKACTVANESRTQLVLCVWPPQPQPRGAARPGWRCSLRCGASGRGLRTQGEPIQYSVLV